jgi:hypothetical protein
VNCVNIMRRFVGESLYRRLIAWRRAIVFEVTTKVRLRAFALIDVMILCFPSHTLEKWARMME